jgi:hypothetical protein
MHIPPNRYPSRIVKPSVRRALNQSNVKMNECWQAKSPKIESALQFTKPDLDWFRMGLIQPAVEDACESRNLSPEDRAKKISEITSFVLAEAQRELEITPDEALTISREMIRRWKIFGASAASQAAFKQLQDEFEKPIKEVDGGKE